MDLGSDGEKLSEGLVVAELPTSGWREKVQRPSLPEAFRSIPVPQTASFWRRLLAFAGPGYLVAVGYMDPGNWATDIAGGAAYNYRLLSVILIANFVAIFLQALAVKLGIVTGRDLAQACRDAYNKPLAIVLWLSAEVSIIACDVAEVIGAAIALKLLFHIPLLIGVILTGADVLVVLALQGRGFRYVEALVITLIGSMMVIFFVEVIYSKPAWAGLLASFIPSREIISHHDMLYIALGIMGATVMPHNLYLHSSLVQTRRFGTSLPELKQAIQCAYTDSTIALMLALFVNAAILIVAASTFYHSGHRDVADIEQAYKLLTPLLGAALATPLFAIALLASGQNSTLTGTMAGQIILEGFTHFKIPAWVRRMISRLVAIVPCVFITYWFGSGGIANLMIFSQVVLSAQLSFAVVPLVQFTCDRQKMGPFVNGPTTKFIGYALALIIAALNTYLVYTTLFPAKGH